MSEEVRPAEAEELRFAGLRFAAEAVDEVDGNQVMIHVPRAQVRAIALRNGFHSAHPVLQIVAGLVLTGIGVLPAMHLAHWLVEGGTFFSMEALLVAFLFLGPWLVFDATKRGYFLDITTDQGRKKLAFDRSADPVELQEFLSGAESGLGYRVEREVK